MPRLPARLAAALATQRLRRGLGERRIRRRRLRRVLRILPQLPPQLGDLGLELRDPLGLNSDESGKLLIRGARIISHHSMIRGQPRTSTRHACQTTTNTKVTSVTRDAWHLTSYDRSCRRPWLRDATTYCRSSPTCRQLGPADSARSDACADEDHPRGWSMLVSDTHQPGQLLQLGLAGELVVDPGVAAMLTHIVERRLRGGLVRGAEDLRLQIRSVPAPNSHSSAPRSCNQAMHRWRRLHLISVFVASGRPRSWTRSGRR